MHQAGRRDSNVELREIAPDTDFIVHLSDGRPLGLRAYGAPDGRPVLGLHGTPGSRLKFRLASSLARDCGLRLYCPDRWGYGLTATPLSRPAFSGFAADMCELADALGLDRFAVVGISGGGPFAAAVAAEMSDRIDRLALIAPVGPLSPGPLQQPIGPFHRFAFAAWPKVPGGMRLTFSAFRGLLAISPTLAVAAAAARAGTADRRIFRDRANAQALGEIMRAGLVQGVDGPVIDMKLFAEDWGVDLSAITAPTRLWLGLEDRNVPIGPARNLACTITGATLTEIADAGHFWIMRNYGEVFQWLASEPNGNRAGKTK